MQSNFILNFKPKNKKVETEIGKKQVKWRAEILKTQAVFFFIFLFLMQNPDV